MTFTDIHETHYMKLPLPESVDGFLRLPQVLELVPVSRSGWWQGVKEKRYPQPVKLSPRVTVWKKSEIIYFVERMTAESKQGTKP